MLNLVLGVGVFSLRPIFQGIFKRENGALRNVGKWPIKVRKRPIKVRKRPIDANGQFSGTPPWWKTAPLKGPLLIRGLMKFNLKSGCRKRRSAKGVRSLFSVFRTLSVTFWSLFLMLLSLFSALFCQTPFADSFCGRVKIFSTFWGDFLTQSRRPGEEGKFQ